MRSILSIVVASKVKVYVLKCCGFNFTLLFISYTVLFMVNQSNDDDILSEAIIGVTDLGNLSDTKSMVWDQKKHDSRDEKEEVLKQP